MGSFDPSEALVLFEHWKVCIDHREELKTKIEELQMNPCSKCGSPTIQKSGVSQKTGKPYTGNKCTMCNNMDFPKRSFGNRQPSQDMYGQAQYIGTTSAYPEKSVATVTLNDLNKKLDLIIKHLKISPDASKNFDENVPF